MAPIFLAESIEIVSKEAFSILLFLLPGFITAWVFFGLTAYPRKEPFERLVQALIFTMFVKGLNILARKLWWMWWHPHHQFGYWTDEKEFVWSLVDAVLLGLIVSILANQDLVQKLLRGCRITYRNSYPPNTYDSFDKKKRFVVLTLKDERRVEGWAKEFPDQCDKGYFLLLRVRWLNDEGGTDVSQPEVETTMIDVVDVKMVQFLVIKKTPQIISQQDIAVLARSIWEQNNDRRDVQDWFEAEKQLRQEASEPT